MWDYESVWASEYDRRINHLIQRVVPPTGARIITGASELQLDSDDVADRIGHLRYGIGAMKFIEGLKTWAYSFDVPQAKL